MALSGGGTSVAGTNVLFREVHKNAWLRRLPVADKKTGAHPKKGERVWTVFCVHDDIEPFLELYNDQKVAVAHKPDWCVSLSNTLHISPTICPQDDEFEFVITLPENVVRLTASSWEMMMEWVDSIGTKLREMHILSPKENVYSRMPEMRAPLLPTRDPNSPLPLPPVGPLTVVPGVEPLSVGENEDALNEHINDRHSSNSHSNNLPVPTTSVFIAPSDNISTVYASSSAAASSSPQAPTSLNNVTVIHVKSDSFDFSSIADSLPNETNRRKNENVVNEDEALEESRNEDDDDDSDEDEDEDEEEDDDDDIFATPVTITPILPRIPNNFSRSGATPVHQTSSHSSDDNVIHTSVTHDLPRVKSNNKRHHSFNNHSSCNSNVTLIQQQDQHNLERSIISDRDRISSTNESNTILSEHSSTSAPADNSHNDNNVASSSSSSGSSSNINLYEHVFLSTNQQPSVPLTSPNPVQDSLNNQDVHLLQDHNTPPPAPVVSSGRSRSGLRQTRRRSSESSLIPGGVPVAADRIRRLQPPPHPFRQNSSLTDCDTVSIRLTLREQQVLQLRREMNHPGGVRLQLRRKDCLNSIALVDAFGFVWIAGWKQKDHPMLYNALHIGDQIISVAGVRVLNSADAQKLIRGAPSLYVAFVIRRVPFGRVFALKRESEGQPLGLVQEGGTPEIKDVIAGGLASLHGLPPRTPSVDGLSLTTWTLTEINGRPLNLFFKENEVRDRLNAVGLDISLLVQPSDLIKQIKKQLKSHRSYKDYIVQ